MKIEPSGVVIFGECELQLSHCIARTPAPITAVWASPSRRQINVCRPCLQDMVREGEWEIPGARLPRRYDIAVYDRTDTLQLVVEVKLRPQVPHLDSTAWATRVYRNLTLHSAVPASRFFILAAYPGPFFLWIGTSSTDKETPPDYSFDVQSELQAYLVGADLTSRKEAPLALATIEWLASIVNVEAAPHPEGHAWLFQSGLYHAIQGGRIMAEAPAEERAALQAA